LLVTHALEHEIIAKKQSFARRTFISVKDYIDIIAITETKLNENNKNLISLSDYNFVNKNSSSHAGGVAI